MFGIPLSTKEHILLLYSLYAGFGNEEARATQSRSYFLDRGYRHIDVKDVDGRGIEALISRLCREHPNNTTIIAAGGDTTLKRVVDIIIKNNLNPNLGVYAWGYQNFRAQSLGIITDPENVGFHIGDIFRKIPEYLSRRFPIEVYYPDKKFHKIILKNNLVPVDVAKMRGRKPHDYFLSWVGFGITGELIKPVQDRVEHFLKGAAYLPDVAKIFDNYAPEEFEVVTTDLEGRTETHTCYSVDIGKNERYGHSWIPYFKDAEPDDGILHVMMVTDPALFANIPELFAKGVKHIVMQDFRKHPQIKYVQAKEVIVIPKKDVGGHIDGEYSDFFRGDEYEITVLGKRLNMYAGKLPRETLLNFPDYSS